MIAMFSCPSHKLKTLLQKYFFAHLQVRHYINTNIKLTQDTILFGPIEKFIINFTLNKGFISSSIIMCRAVKYIILISLFTDGRRTFRVFIMKRTGKNIFETPTLCFSVTHLKKYSIG